MAPEPTTSNGEERSSLIKRIIPEMRLSDGSPASMTAPPGPTPHYLNAAGRAQYRFAVEGNAILTGGAGDLAQEAARALLEHGSSGVALLDIDAGAATAAAEALQKDFPECKVISAAVDVTDEGSVTAAFEKAAGELGGVDVLCCFAGVVGCNYAIEMSAREWRRCMEINATGGFLCGQAAARHMVKQERGGSIVFIASISAHRVNFPQPQVAYNVSKAAVGHMTRCLAAEWAHYGIRVNSISPGYMDTILNEGPGLEKVRNTWAARNPMGRMGAPSELTGPVILLCSNAGTYINGADLVVDGGGVVF